MATKPKTPTVSSITRKKVCPKKPSEQPILQTPHEEGCFLPTEALIFLAIFALYVVGVVYMWSPKCS